LGPADRTAAGHRLDLHAGNQPGVSATGAATGDNARNTGSQRWVANDHAAESAARARNACAGATYVKYSGKRYDNSGNASPGGKRRSIRQRSAGHDCATFERLFDAKSRPFVGLFQPGCVVIGHHRDTVGNPTQHSTGQSLSHMALVIDHARRHIPLDQRASSCGHRTQLFRANHAHAGRSAAYQFAACRLGAGLRSPRWLRFSR
jgi:hypothetical protein